MMATVEFVGELPAGQQTALAGVRPRTRRGSRRKSAAKNEHGLQLNLLPRHYFYVTALLHVVTDNNPLLLPLVFT